MGVDAEMVVASPQELDAASLLRLSYETGSAFGPRHFWLDREGRYGEPRHILSAGTDYEIDLADDAVTVFTVHLVSRYYGENYERGDLPLILALARWFRSKLPGSTVFYGGDSGIGLAPLTTAREDQLWAHFVEHQHFPYIDFDRRSLMGGDNIEQTFCSFCQEPMLRYGWGPNYASFSCPGCGWKQETRDGGQTWTEPKELV